MILQRLALLLLTITLVWSCHKSDDDDSEADGSGNMMSYKLTFDATWSADTHPTSFPSNPHFSKLIGATHNSTYTMYSTTSSASDGIKSMAETGGTDTLSTEIKQAITDNKAYGLILAGSGLGSSPGSTSITFTADSDFPLVSVTTMIAPSPDWFVGTAGTVLYKDGEWVAKAEVTLYAYDAGTDSGTTYTSADTATDPRENIARLNDTPFTKDKELGKFTFEKQ